eukprot:m.31221 g.31221  ORF g.31221 m.31221 type:complete len:52 (-) comp9297_c0_seq1:239-394(-)
MELMFEVEFELNETACPACDLCGAQSLIVGCSLFCGGGYTGLRVDSRSYPV